VFKLEIIMIFSSQNDFFHNKISTLKKHRKIPAKMESCQQERNENFPVRFPYWFLPGVTHVFWHTHCAQQFVSCKNDFCWFLIFLLTAGYSFSQKDWICHGWLKPFFSFIRWSKQYLISIRVQWLICLWHTVKIG